MFACSSEEAKAPPPSSGGEDAATSDGAIPPVNGVVPDAGSAADAGDAGSDAETSKCPKPTFTTAQCGEASCNGNLCCKKQTKNLLFCGATDLSSACAIDLGTPIECTGPCNAGRCCGAFQTAQANVLPAPTADGCGFVADIASETRCEPSGACQDNEEILCRSDADCPGIKTCKPLTLNNYAPDGGVAGTLTWGMCR